MNFPSFMSRASALVTKHNVFSFSSFVSPAN